MKYTNKAPKASQDPTKPSVDVAGMAPIAGTLSGPNFGGALDRIKSLHVAVKLLASKGPAPHKYSGEPGAAYKKLFEQMQKVMDGTVPLDTKIDNGLTIQQWFNGGFVGDFLYLLEYELGPSANKPIALLNFL